MSASAEGLALRLLLRERVVLGLSLATMIGLAWAYMLWMGLAMDDGPGAWAYCSAASGMFGMSGMDGSGWSAFGWLLAMWSVMAVAMMLPTTIPMLMLFARHQRWRHPERDASAPTLYLAAGYLLVWVAFGIFASALQWGLERAGMLTPMMGALRSATVAGLVVIGAGAFQLSPLKYACLSRCRTPLAFLMTAWRDGRAGALRMGFEHGLFCLGCCWALMLVLFVTGVMDLVWMAALTVLMLLEKIVPRGDWFARIGGVAMILLGIAMLVR